MADGRHFENRLRFERIMAMSLVWFLARPTLYAYFASKNSKLPKLSGYLLCVSILRIFGLHNTPSPPLPLEVGSLKSS